MRIDRFSPAAIVRDWPWVSALLSPSIAVDPWGDPEFVKASLLNGSMGLASVHVDKGVGLVVVQPGVFDGIFCCWMPYVALKVKLPPKAWMRTVVSAMQHFEAMARQSGCREMRIGGRDWSFLPGYAPFNDKPMLRKVLL